MAAGDVQELDGGRRAAGHGQRRSSATSSAVASSAALPRIATALTIPNTASARRRTCRRCGTGGRTTPLSGPGPTRCPAPGRCQRAPWTRAPSGWTGCLGVVGGEELAADELEPEISGDEEVRDRAARSCAPCASGRPRSCQGLSRDCCTSWSCGLPLGARVRGQNLPSAISESSRARGSSPSAVASTTIQERSW